MNNDDDNNVLERLLAHYGRNPKYLDGQFKDMFNSKAGNAKTCSRCETWWLKAHRCSSGNVSDHFRNISGNGENHIDIISDLICETQETWDYGNIEEEYSGENQTHLSEFDRILDCNDARKIKMQFINAGMISIIWILIRR